MQNAEEYIAMIQSLYNGPNIQYITVENIVQETITDSASGTENNYDLLLDPLDPKTVEIFSNGSYMNQEMYTIIGKTITFLNNIPAGYNLSVRYIKA
jgi:hypothetical protein